MSPVKAPEGSAWQSCAPIATAELRARVAKPAIKVAGGQTRRSMRVASGPAPSITLASSVADCWKPFIFQLPAMSGRSALVMANPLPLAFASGLAERLGRDQRRPAVWHFPWPIRAVAAAAGSPYDATTHGSHAAPPMGPPENPFAHNTVGPCFAV